MNRYGQLARDHWMRWLPGRYAGLADPEGFFTELGEQAAIQVTDLQEQILSASGPVGDYLVAVGRHQAARMSAEEVVLGELILLAPEPEVDGETGQVALLETADGMPADRDHPLWAMSEDPDVSVEEFAQALRAWRAQLPPR